MKYGPKPGGVSNIESSPKKSKHLETAGTKIGIGYRPFQSGVSRILEIVGFRIWPRPTGLGRPPNLHPTTPERNLRRRPPLRVLRLIRFALCVGFTIAPKTKAAMKLPGVKGRLSLTNQSPPPVLQSALKTKISRERVGIGIRKMMEGRPLQRDICPTNPRPPPPPVQDMKIAADIVRRRLSGSTSSHPRISKLLATGEKYLV
ncbi:hypothetical protein HOY82DRAFT_628465 [Tuber indicum]|nr:hypothetical protein HOY82DRAFT_628465 [Tuber indicum]